VNRKTLEVNSIYNESYISIYYAMKKFPHFNMDYCPFVFLKCQKFISIIDVKKQLILSVIKCPFEIDVPRVQSLELTLIEPSTVQLYTLEFNNKDKTSHIRKY
jgi:hypothetical protein